MCKILNGDFMQIDHLQLIKKSKKLLHKKPRDAPIGGNPEFIFPSMGNNEICFIKMNSFQVFQPLITLSLTEHESFDPNVWKTFIFTTFHTTGSI